MLEGEDTQSRHFSAAHFIYVVCLSGSHRILLSRTIRHHSQKVGEPLSNDLLATSPLLEKRACS
jgi:hypothetical protein